MSGKLVMGYWDCAYCDTKAIEGTKKTCPNCGNPRGEDVKFYMKKGKVTYLTEEESKTKGKGSDWMCEFCGSYNSVLNDSCSNCGAERTNRDYHTIQKEKEEKEKAKAANQSTKQPKQKPEKKMKKRYIIGIAALLFVLFSVISYQVSRIPKNLTVTDKTWTTTVSVEKYQLCEESDWDLPAGAELQSKKKEIHHYEQRQIGTKTEEYQSYEKVGSHTETEYVDNGDGSFTEETVTVDDYDYVTRTREVPEYVDEPVYQTKYYYTIWRWKVDHENTKTGHDETPVYDTITDTDELRNGEQTVEFKVMGTVKDKEVEYTVGESIYHEIEVGTDIRVRAPGGEIIELLD